MTHKLPLTSKAEFSVERATPRPKQGQGQMVSMRELPHCRLAVQIGSEVRPVLVESGNPQSLIINGQEVRIDLISLSMGKLDS